MTIWTIAQLERNTSDGGVVVAHWRATATDGDYSASSYGTCGFTPDPTAPDFVPFESLTEADVLAWVYESVDKDATEEAHWLVRLKIRKRHRPLQALRGNQRQL
jgi:hypothetical protein